MPGSGWGKMVAGEGCIWFVVFAYPGMESRYFGASDCFAPNAHHSPPHTPAHTPECPGLEPGYRVPVHTGSHEDSRSRLKAGTSGGVAAGDTSIVQGALIQRNPEQFPSVVSREVSTRGH
jgi:hypothetical protein